MPRTASTPTTVRAIAPTPPRTAGRECWPGSKITGSHRRGYRVDGLLLRSGGVTEDGNRRCRLGQQRARRGFSNITIEEGETVGDDRVVEGAAQIGPSEMAGPLQLD